MASAHRLFLASLLIALGLLAGPFVRPGNAKARPHFGNAAPNVRLTELPTPSAGEQTTVGAMVTPPNNIDRVTLYYRRGGETGFQTVPMERTTGNTYEGVVPAAAVTVRGVEVYVEAVDTDDEASYAPEDGYAAIPVRTDNLEISINGGTEESDYRPFSIPLDLDQQGIIDLLTQILGPYDPHQWRLYAIGSDGLFSDGTGGYVEVTDSKPRAVEPGASFFLLTRNDTTIRSGPGTSIPTDQSFEVSLRAGWNLVSSPFAFPLPREAVYPSDDEDGSNDVEVLTYEGEFVPVEPGDQLEPFSGYLVRFSGPDPTAGALTIDPTRPAEHNGDGNGDEGNDLRTAETARWTIRVKARAGEARDRYNRLGVVSTARPGWDRLDRYEPPPLGSFVSIASLPRAGGERYRTDMRPPAETHAWTLQVRSSTDAPVHLRFQGLRDVPASRSIRLIDEQTSRTHDLRRSPHVTLPPSDGDARFLTLVVSSDAERPLGEATPREVLLLPNAPNPVQRQTTLRYGLPEKADVRLAVYDLLGRCVAVLADGRRPAGFHTVIWDGRDRSGRPLASGPYFYRLEAGGRVRTRSLMLVR